MAWYDAQIPAWIRPAQVTPTEGGNAFAQGLEIGTRQKQLRLEDARQWQALRLQEARDAVNASVAQAQINHVNAQTDLLKIQAKEAEEWPTTMSAFTTDWTNASGNPAAMRQTYDRWIGPLSRTPAGRAVLLNADRALDDLTGMRAKAELTAQKGHVFDAILAMPNGPQRAAMVAKFIENPFDPELIAALPQMPSSRALPPEHARIVEAETITRKRRQAALAREEGDEELAKELEAEARYIETTAPHQGLEQSIDLRAAGALRLAAQKSIQKLEAELAAAQTWEHAIATDPKFKESESAYMKPPRSSVQVAAELEALKRNLQLMQSLPPNATPAPTPAVDPNDPLGILSQPQP